MIQIQDERKKGETPDIKSNRGDRYQLAEILQPETSRHPCQICPGCVARKTASGNRQELNLICFERQNALTGRSCHFCIAAFDPRASLRSQSWRGFGAR